MRARGLLGREGVVAVLSHAHVQGLGRVGRAAVNTSSWIAFVTVLMVSRVRDAGLLGPDGTAVPDLHARSPASPICELHRLLCPLIPDYRRQVLPLSTGVLAFSEIVLIWPYHDRQPLSGCCGRAGG